MTVDSHQHFWKFDPVRDAWITPEMGAIRRDFLPEDLAPILRNNGIDGCVAVQADQSATETKFLCDLAGQNDFILGVVGWVDLFATNLDEQLHAYSRIGKLKGFRHIVQGEPAGFMSNPAFIEGVRRLGTHGFTYDLLVYHYQLREALHFIKQVEGVRIVIDHIAKPSIRTGEIAQWKKDMTAVSAFGNVNCKISGMVTEANWKEWTKDQIVPYMEEVLERFGPRRLMYGSDWPVCLVAASYDRQLEVVLEFISTLSKEERDSIMGENARAFYVL